MEEPEQFYPKDRDAWRNWLKKNHERKSKVAVIRYKKHTNKPSPSHSELMHEAICFGWIDTTVKRLDEDRYIINFSKRSKNSKWSDNTISYGKMLLAEGKMFPQGIKYYNEGLRKPTHDFGIPKNPEMPEELKIKLNKNKIAKLNFEKLAPSRKKAIYREILKAKLKETRDKRIDNLIKSLLEKD